MSLQENQKKYLLEWAYQSTGVMLLLEKSVGIVSILSSPFQSLTWTSVLAGGFELFLCQQAFKKDSPVRPLFLIPASVNLLKIFWLPYFFDPSNPQEVPFPRVAAVVAILSIMVSTFLLVAAL